MTATTNTKFNFALRLFIGANFLIFIYDLVIPHHATATLSTFFTPFFWFYALVMMLTELSSEPNKGLEEIGASFLYGLFASATIIIAMSSLSIILATIFFFDWQAFYSAFKMLVSIETLVALYWSVKDYYVSVYTDICAIFKDNSVKKVPVKVVNQQEPNQTQKVEN